VSQNVSVLYLSENLEVMEISFSNIPPTSCLLPLAVLVVSVIVGAKGASAS
jgi:hypothetical protein